METWAQRGLISESGKAFLVATLDPFHDSQIEHLCGYPDIETSPSIVRMVKQSVTITKPAGMPAGNWDCQIVCWPWMKKMSFSECEFRANNRLYGTFSPVQPLGGLQALAVPSSDGSFDLNNANVVEAASLTLADDILQGSNRLIGAGYEVHDTTAELYKQGAVCNYMMHNVPKDASLFVALGTANAPPTANYIANAFNGTSFRSIPRNTAEALLIPGSNEWAAKDGVYSVCRFAGVENPPFTVDYNLPVLFETDDIPSSRGSGPNFYPDYPNTSQVIFPTKALDTNLGQSPAWKSFPIHTSGSIFTGLAESASLRLNFNCIVENFPGPRDTKDLSIARPSASFDPRCLEIYSHTLCHAPVAVPVGENPLGEWFMDVVSKVGNFLGNMPGIPGLIGKAAAGISETMKPFMTSPSGQNAPIQRQPRPQKAIQAAPRAIQPVNKPKKSVTQKYWSGLTPAQRKEQRAEYNITIIQGPAKGRK